MKYCFNPQSGALFGHSEGIAKRPDLLTFIGALKEAQPRDPEALPQERLDLPVQYRPQTYESACPDHLVPLTKIGETWPHFYIVPDMGFLTFRNLLAAGKLTDCLHRCRDLVYLGIAEYDAVLRQFETVIPGGENYAAGFAEKLAEIKRTLLAKNLDRAQQALSQAKQDHSSAAAQMERIQKHAATLDVLDPAISLDAIRDLRSDAVDAKNRMSSTEARLQDAQQRLDETRVEACLPATAVAPAGDFKAPSQKEMCAQLDCSERNLRDKFDSFKIDLEIDNLHWARMTQWQFERFGRWLEKERAAA